MEAESKRILLKRVFLTIALATLIWAIWHAMYAVPGMDDFAYGTKARHMGLIQNVIDEYQHWDGRYVSAFFWGLFARSSFLITQGYYLVPAAILVLNLVAAWYFLSSLKLRDRTFLIMFFAALISAYCWNEGILWLTGGVAYGVSCAVFLVLLSEQLKIHLGDNPPSLPRSLVLAVIAFLLAGFNEAVMAAQFSIITLLLAQSILFKDDRKTILGYALILAATLIGVVIVVSAPGNGIRSQYFPTPDLLYSIKMTIWWFFERYLFQFLLSMLLFYILIVIFSPRLEKLPHPKRLVSFSLILAAALWTSIFTRAFAERDFGEHRVQQLDFVIVTVASFLIAWLLYLRNYPDSRTVRLTGPKMALFIFAFLVSYILRPGPDGLWLHVLNRMKYTAEYRHYISQRLELVKKVAGSGKIFIAPAGLELHKYTRWNRPITMHPDITSDPKQWENLGFAMYFGLKQVRLADSASSVLPPKENQPTNPHSR